MKQRYLHVGRALVFGIVVLTTGACPADDTTGDSAATTAAATAGTTTATGNASDSTGAVADTAAETAAGTGPCGNFDCPEVSFCYVPAVGEGSGSGSAGTAGSEGGSSGEPPGVVCPENCDADSACGSHVSDFEGCGGCGGGFCSYSFSPPMLVDGECCYSILGQGTNCGDG